MNREAPMQLQADRRLHPATLLIRFIKQVPEFVVGLPAFAALAADAGLGLVLLLALAGAALALTLTLLSWLRFKYGVGDREVVIENGVLHRKRRVIPFDRVQDIDIEQRLLARLFGVATVRIETGGGGKDEGSLNAVSLEEAHHLREIIRRGAAPLGDTKAPEAQAGEPVLFRMDMRRLVIAGLFNFSLLYLAVLGGAFQYFDPLLDRFLAEPERWKLPSTGWARRYGISATLTVLLLLILLGIVTGVVRTIARDYRFRLSRTATGFRRRRGLFTLSEALIPLNRVQLALVESGWLRRRLGWFSLDFQTLSTEAQQSGHQDAAPLATLEELMPILAEAGIAHLPAEGAYIRVSRRMILRQSLAVLLPVTAAIIIAGFFSAALLSLLFPVALAGLGLTFAWRRHRYAFAEGTLYIGEGLLRTRLWIMPFAKLQSVSVRRSPLQRKLGLATVEIDTAGGSMFRYPAVRDLADADAEALAERLIEQYRAARSVLRRGPSAALSDR